MKTTKTAVYRKHVRDARKRSTCSGSGLAVGSNPASNGRMACCPDCRRYVFVVEAPPECPTCRQPPGVQCVPVASDTYWETGYSHDARKVL
jgi:hypothetical protein